MAMVLNRSTEVHSVSITDSLPAPLWCKDRNTHPRCSCTDGCTGVDFSHSLHHLPPPPEYYQIDWKRKVPKACYYIKHSLKKWKICVGLNKKIKPDQSLILCSHSIISFTCGGPPGPQSFKALNNKVKNEDKGLYFGRYSSSSSTKKVIGLILHVNVSLLRKMQFELFCIIREVLSKWNELIFNQWFHFNKCIVCVYKFSININQQTYERWSRLLTLRGLIMI